MKSREQLENEVSDMCDQAGCKDKIRKVHFDQYVNKHWRPHPPQEFVSWWYKQKTYKESGMGAKVAYNAQVFYQSYLEAKQVGLA